MLLPHIPPMTKPSKAFFQLQPNIAIRRTSGGQAHDKGSNLLHQSHKSNDQFWSIGMTMHPRKEGKKNNNNNKPLAATNKLWHNYNSGILCTGWPFWLRPMIS
jgi:hypothetical protein